MPQSSNVHAVHIILMSGGKSPKPESLVEFRQICRTLILCGVGSARRNIEALTNATKKLYSKFPVDLHFALKLKVHSLQWRLRQRFHLSHSEFSQPQPSRCHLTAFARTGLRWKHEVPRLNPSRTMFSVGCLGWQKPPCSKSDLGIRPEKWVWMHYCKPTSNLLSIAWRPPMVPWTRYISLVQHLLDVFPWDFIWQVIPKPRIGKRISNISNA